MNQASKEKPHICQYCDKKCFKRNREMKRHWWWHCDACDVSFLVSIKGHLNIIVFKTKVKNEKFYSVNVMVREKRTDFFVWSPDEYAYDDGVGSYQRTFIKRFDQVLEVTPQNFEHKIKTIITFL